MSDSSPEDEIMSEARKFAASMSMTLRRYAQAANWMERRKIRKEIKQAWRSELREQEAERANQLLLTQRAVDRFRAHSLKVAERAADPSVDHERRYRDAQHLARHRNDMAERVLRNPRLTVVEQGIALDGLDAASKFPTHNHGRLFDKARRVKGLQALHYRATVARAQESAGVPRPGREIEPTRYTATVASQAEGSQLWLEQPTRRFVTEAGAVDWLHRQVADTHWHGDTRVHVEAWDLDDVTEPVYTDQGRPDTVRGHLAAHAIDVRESADNPWRRARAVELAREELATPGGWIAEEDRRPGFEERDLTRAYETTLFAREQGERAMALQEAREQQQDRYSSTVTYLPEGASQVVHAVGQHPSEQESAAWTRHQLDAIRPAPGTTVHIAAYDHDGEGHADPVFRSEGARGALSQEIDAWTASTLRSSQPDRGESETSAPSRETEIEREFAALKDRHRLSIQHNNALVERNGQLTKQLTALTAERDQLRDTASELTDQAATRNGAQHGHDWAGQFIAAVDGDEREQRAGRDTGLTVLRAEQARPRIHDQLSDQARAVMQKAEQRQAAQERQWAEDEESNHDIKAFHEAQADRPGTVRTPSVGQLIAERDRLRIERDEAVHKLVERTPADERYGSPERQATQARREQARSVAESALSGYQPGTTLADALARGEQNNEREAER
ncbi:hypothetical protein [Nocardia brasiliensis]|uniref:hypothetical protein n=1 Tax=Nocardia brasiliensis TaxID=37326 RepID=UPI0024578B08|nr:hypothetical protein [Nocardia brasiliensis]